MSAVSVRHASVRPLAEKTPAQLRTNQVWLRGQNASLRSAIAMGPERLTLADIERALGAIERGEDWRSSLRR